MPETVLHTSPERVDPPVNRPVAPPTESRVSVTAVSSFDVEMATVLTRPDWRTRWLLRPRRVHGARTLPGRLAAVLHLATAFPLVQAPDGQAWFPPTVLDLPVTRHVATLLRRGLLVGQPPGPDGACPVVPTRAGLAALHLWSVSPARSHLVRATL